MGVLNTPVFIVDRRVTISLAMGVMCRYLFLYFFLLSICLEAAEIYITTDIGVDTNLVAENNYFLDGVVSVLPGATLTIDPGTIIRGLPASETSDGNLSALFVLPGAHIVAKGTAESPIIFTNKNDNLTTVNPENFGDTDGYKVNADFNNSALSRWGGIYILGDAYVDEMGTENIYYSDPHIPTGTGPFERIGLIKEITTLLGTSPYPLLRSYNLNDDSGEIEYVSIRYTGDAREYPPERGDRNYTIQPSALTLYGVGNDTSITNIEVFNAGDDAYLLWGGSVEPSYLAAFIFGDECFEIDCGWSGVLERIFGYGIIHSSEFIEVDSYPSGSVTMDVSDALVSFATYIGFNNRRGMIVGRGGNLDVKNSYLSFYEDVSILSDPASGISLRSLRPSGIRFDNSGIPIGIRIYNSSFLSNYDGDPWDYTDYLYGITADSELHFSPEIYSDGYALVESLRSTKGAFAYGENWTNWMIGHQYLSNISAEYVALTLPQEIDYTVDSDSDGIPDNYDIYDGLDDALFEYYLQNNVLPNYKTLTEYNRVVAERDARLTTDEVRDARVGSTMIEVSGGKADITMTLEETSDLSDWSNATTSDKTIEVDASPGTRFYRFKMSE